MTAKEHPKILHAFRTAFPKLSNGRWHPSSRLLIIGKRNIVDNHVSRAGHVEIGIINKFELVKTNSYDIIMGKLLFFSGRQLIHESPIGTPEIFYVHISVMDKILIALNDNVRVSSTHRRVLYDNVIIWFATDSSKTWRQFEAMHDNTVNHLGKNWGHNFHLAVNLPKT